MKSHQLQVARSRFSQLVEEALRGEPQRITRRGRDAVVLVSEAEWLKRASPPMEKEAQSLKDILLANPLEPEEWDQLLVEVRGRKRPAGSMFVDEDET